MSHKTLQNVSQFWRLNLACQPAGAFASPGILDHPAPGHGHWMSCHVGHGSAYVLTRLELPRDINKMSYDRYGPKGPYNTVPALDCYKGTSLRQAIGKPGKCPGTVLDSQS